jgi:elongation factor P hydroxylase
MFFGRPIYYAYYAYSTSWKVAGSIPDGVIGIFHWYNPSGRTMALGSTQPLTEMSTRNISWGVKAAGA